jgi:hypothetical protein
MEVTDKIWTQNVEILYQKNRLTEIMPTKDMTLPEKLNALMRLSILAGIASVILFSDYKYLYIPMMMAMIQIGAIHMEPTILDKKPINVDDVTEININDDTNDISNESGNQSNNDADTLEGFNLQDMNDDTLKEKLKPEMSSCNVTPNKLCVKPTKNNPFMNAMNYDSRYRQPACTPIGDEVIQENIDDFFNDNLFKDVSDIYNKRASQRQFFTMPYTTYPNDGGNFAKWLYGRPRTCKEGNGAQCVANNYERLQGGSYKMV